MPSDIRPNHILVVSIQKPYYPITTDVLYTIMSPFGVVQRIVIFHRNGVRAMIEFDSIASATRAMQVLNGAEIYAGCCVLQIEFSRNLQKLNVRRNDDESWDYTVAQSRTALSAPMAGTAMVAASTYGQSRTPQLYMPGSGVPAPGMPSMVPAAAMMGPNSTSGPVIMVYHLDTKRVTCAMVFNLFCLYGNVHKVKVRPVRPAQ